MPAALIAPDPSQPLPDSLPDGAADAPPSPAPVTAFITVDTEDAYFRRPHMITGEGIGREYGVHGILDELDARGLAATFFVNVYERDRQPPNAIRAIVRHISDRGHEVGLHSHPTPGTGFYERPLFRLTREQQLEVLRWGQQRLEEWTGLPVTSFRAGGYAINEDTYPALEQLGILVDSSAFFSSPNNHLTHVSVNAPHLRGGVLVVPVTSVARRGPDGSVEHRKLDIDWLSVEQLTSAMGDLGRHGARFAMTMMHSFSFIEKATRRPEEEPSAQALFTSEELFGRYVEIYGPKPAMRRAFVEFLDMLVADPETRVRTLREAVPDLRAAVDGSVPDVVPVVARR